MPLGIFDALNLKLRLFSDYFIYLVFFSYLLSYLYANAITFLDLCNGFVLDLH
jgi:hypothetical protein